MYRMTWIFNPLRTTASLVKLIFREGGVGGGGPPLTILCLAEKTEDFFQPPYGKIILSLHWRGFYRLTMNAS